MKTLKILLAGLTLTALVQAAHAQDATKVGILNPLQALFNSDAAQVEQEELRQEFSEDETRAADLAQQLQQLQQDFQQNQAVMTEEQIRRMNSNAQDLRVQLQLIQERVQTALQERNQEFLGSMEEELAAAVSDVVAEGGFDIILNSEAVPYFAPAYDITARVTAKLNENAQGEE